MISIVILLIKAFFLHAIFVTIGFVAFFIIWAKLAFYYFYARSIKSYDFFVSAYESGIIQLRVGKNGKIVSHPEPWFYALLMGKGIIPE